MILPIFINITKAETESYSGYYYMGVYGPVDQAYDDLYYGDLVIITDSENASGTIRVGGINYEYQGTYTYYSHLALGVNNPAGLHSYYISGTFTGTATYTLQDVSLNDTQYQGLISSINSINTTDTNILNYLATMKNELLNAINDIDDLIDIISWDIINPTITVYDNSRNIITDTNRLNAGTYYLLFNNLPNGSIGIIENLIRFSSTMNNITSSFNLELGLYRLDNGQFNSNGLITYIDSLTNTWGNYLYKNNVVYIDSNYVPAIKIIAPIRFDINNNITIKSITHNDIEYWTLISYLEQHNYYNSKNNELDQPNDDLSNAVDDYIEQEDDLIDDFDTSMSNPALDPTSSSSNPSNWGNTFISSLSFIGYVFNTLTGASTGGNAFYLMINMSLMLGIALLIIGKRAI